MAKKLYVREITYRAYVFAEEDEFEDNEYDDEIIRDALSPDDERTYVVDVNAEAHSKANPLGWDGGCIVYGDGEETELRQLLGNDVFPSCWAVSDHTGAS